MAEPLRFAYCTQGIKLEIYEPVKGAFPVTGNGPLEGVELSIPTTSARTDGLVEAIRKCSACKGHGGPINCVLKK